MTTTKMLTFKTFLEAERSPPFKLSKEKFDALKGPTVGNVDRAFRVGKVAFDNERGFGHTPNNEEVMYFGFVAEMKPTDFLKLVPHEDRTEDAKKFVRFIGELAPMASPMLYLNTNMNSWKAGEPLRVQVQQHEGRGRLWAIKDVEGNVPVPVHFIINGGYRAKDLNKEFFDALRENGIVAQGGSEHLKPYKVELNKIFWNGETL